MSDASRVATAFTIDERYLQGAGVVQGGVVAGMLGDAMGAVAHATLDADAPLLHEAVLETLDVAFLRPAPAGDFVATARMTRRARSTIHVQAEVSDAAGRVVATGRATYVLQPKDAR